jgi:hypothetical protein
MDSEPFYLRKRFWLTVIALFLASFSCYSFWPENNQFLHLLTGSQVSTPDQKLRALEIVAFNCFIGFLPFLILGMFLISPFVLPIKTFNEWFLLVKRMILQMLHRHGLAVHVKDGRVLASEDEEKRSGAGVILIDPNSALVLKKQFGVLSQTNPRNKKRGKAPGSQMRACGPGIAFSRGNEVIQGVVDLRKQIRVQPNVRAYTADGIEIESVLLALFTLGQPADVLYVTCIERAPSVSSLRVVNLQDKDGGKVIQSLTADDLDEADKAEIIRDLNDPPQAPTWQRINDYMVYDPERVFAAVSSQVFDQTGRIRSWTEFPLEFAIGVFRDLIGRVKYDSFFSTDATSFPLGNYQDSFRKIIRSNGVLSYQYVRPPFGRPFTVGQMWDESKLQIFPVRQLRNSKFLRDHGIKIIHAGFLDLKPVNPEIQKQRVDTWSARWEREFSEAMADSELQANRIRFRARAQAQREMVYTLSQILEGKTYSQEAMAMRVFQALETAAADPATRRMIPRDTINLLRTLRQIILQDDTTPPAPPEEDMQGLI